LPLEYFQIEVPVRKIFYGRWPSLPISSSEYRRIACQRSTSSARAGFALPQQAGSAGRARVRCSEEQET
jgi:hypothetical protein